MKSAKLSLFLPTAVASALLALTNPVSAQLIAYDDAGNYQISANWTNGANRGFGFTPWAIITNGPDFHGNYITAPASPLYANASVTNVGGTNYTCVFGIFANGPTDINGTTLYRGFANPLGTNTFKVQWGAKGAGVTTTVNRGAVHGFCGISLRTGNDTNSVYQQDPPDATAMVYIYFVDGASPSTIYVRDGSGTLPFSVPGTSFSDLGRANITNAIQAEITPGPDGLSYHLELKDCVQNRTLFVTNSFFLQSGTVDSAALFASETTGDQVYNRLQIAAPKIPPTIVNVQPPSGSIYLDPNATTLSFEVDSFNSQVASNLVAVYLNGVAQSNLTFNIAGPTTNLLVTSSATVADNTFYYYTIVAQDLNGNVASNTYTFNTLSANDLYIDAYDYNYGLGQFINASTPSNAYAGLLGTNGVDYSISDLTGVNNNAGYRSGDLPQILSLNTDATGDPIDHANLRGNGFTAYNIGFTDIGNWENYTRVIPAGTNYSIFARAASGIGGQFEIEKLANATATTTNQPLAALGRVNVPITGGSRVYTGQLDPLVDFFGNIVVVPLSGTTTLRETAITSQGYNLEYLVVVAVTNATGTLRPYIATGSPTPNATGVSLSSPITFTLASRNTTVATNAIQLILNNTNVSSRIVTSSNLAGISVSWTPTNNLPSAATNSVVVIITDNTGVSVTNSWNFITGTTGGALGSGVWSGAGGPTDMFWADGVNWTGGTPGPGFNASFSNPGSTNIFITNNIVGTNVSILGLFYNSNTNGFHTTLIQDGVTLTVTNPSTAIGAIVQVGGTTGGDNSSSVPVTNTITGINGKLFVLGNPQSVGGGANQLNFQVRQNTTGAGTPNLVTLDMSGLGTLVATVGKFYVAQGGSGGNQTNQSGCAFLARTNIITCLRANSGQFEVGDSSGGTFESPGSSLYLGITNALFVDTVRFGKQKATNNLVRFNPAFTSITTPAAFIRGTNGLSSRVNTFTIGDADTEATIPNFVQANVDLSGGRVDALINNLILGRGETTAGDSGYAQGTLTVTAGTLDVLNITNGLQRGNNTATESGTITLTSNATLACPNLILAQAAAGANASLVSGMLNVTNGTVRGNIIAGGGVSTVNLNGGTLVVSNAAGTSVAPIAALNLTSASLHLKADGNATTTNIVATTVATSGTTVITIDSVANVTGPKTIHLLGYSGTSPFASLSLAAMPAGFSGSLADNSGSIDLNINVATTVPPTIRNITISGGLLVISGTNNAGAGGTYHVLTTTNLAQPIASWSVLTNGSFDGSGNFSSTNSTGNNSPRFFILSVP